MTLTANVRALAHDYWNFDVLPPQEYQQIVAQYIKEHSEEFGGATPQ